MAVLTQLVQWFATQSAAAKSAEALALVLFTWRLSARWLARLPPGSPPLWKDGGGILGSQKFTMERAEYLAEGIAKSPNGQFSFWHGGNHIVVVSGEAARTSFQMGRGLDPAAGFAALFGSFLDISELTKDSMRRAMLIYKRCTQTDYLTTNLYHLVNDSNTHMLSIPLTLTTCQYPSTTAIIDPQAFLGRLIYQLTHRVAGVHEIANTPSLLQSTWQVYTPLEDSPYIDIMAPWLPTPSKMRKIWGYAKLHLTITRIARERQARDEREEDMLQMLLDARPEFGAGMQSLSVIGAVLAGVFNTTFSTVYTVCQLARDGEWLAKVRAEIDAVIAERQNTSQRGEPLVDTLHRLSVQDWEASFPVLRAAIAESIRFTMAGAVVRKNISLRDIEIGVDGLVIPKGSLTIHATADTHMDVGIYPKPMKWDPSRFLGAKVQGEDVPHGYLGWGSGNHPCPARRFAELNVIVASVLFIAHFDFYICDKVGRRLMGPLPPIIYNRMGAGQLESNVLLECRTRS